MHTNLVYASPSIYIVALEQQKVVQMFHNSHCTMMVAAEREKDKGIKENGSYFQQPLIEQSLSTNNESKRHVFRTTSQAVKYAKFLAVLPGMPGTVKLTHLKCVGVPIKQAYRRHLRIDVKRYLKRKFEKPGWLIPLEQFECLRLLEKAVPKYADTESLLLYKPFFLNGNMKHMIQKCCDMVKQLDLYRILLELIKCSIEFGGLDNFIMTTSNVYFDSDLETLCINETSLTGIALFEAKQPVERKEFFEIAPHVTEEMVKGFIGRQTRIRSFLVCALSFITEYDYYFQPADLGTHSKISYDNLQKAVKESRTNLVGFLDSKENRKMIYQKCEKDEKNRRRLGNKKIPPVNGKTVVPMIHLFDEILRKGNQMTWEEVIEYFSYASLPNPDPELVSAFRKFHDSVWEQEQNKQFYQKRGLSGERLYIPIKMKGHLVDLFRYGCWWELFMTSESEGGAKQSAKKGSKDETKDMSIQELTQNYFDFMHEGFCYKILEVKVQEYETRKEGKKEGKFIDDLVVQAVMRYLMRSSLPIKSDDGNEFFILSTRYKEYANYLQQAQAKKSPHPAT